ncbi:uncharacterized protein LOC141659466 isoform X2 [Apium graveolens]|uniref:uncharacterized protein LOC141659466 isoform X2 n=1 Tax=Apium graveolens TaxID=4045 RepID=UPI003D793985
MDSMRGVREANAVFMVETEDRVTSQVKHGGAICIDPRGLLVTVAHIIPVSTDVSTNLLITVRPRSAKFFMQADISDVNYTFDIAFLAIRRDSENEVFGYVNLPSQISLTEQQRVFSWFHHNVGFSLVTGKISFPYRSRDVVFPSSRSTITIGDDLAGLDERTSRTPRFRTTRGIARTIDKELHNLHPDLPLIEVYNFFGGPGSSGSPVFTSADGSLIGLIMLHHSRRNYVLPIDFIIRYMDEHNIAAAGLMINHKRKRTVEVSESSSRNSRQKTLADLHKMQTVHIVECRRVLKWTYAYGFYLPEHKLAKRQFFEYLQGEAEANLERLHQCAEKELQNYLGDATSEDFSGFRTKLAGLTSVTRNYFENLVRALENGLSNVNSIGASSKTTSSKCVAGSSKTKSGRGKSSFRIGGSSKGAEDPGSWACDQCTYLNPSRSATVCQMCSQRR